VHHHGRNHDDGARDPKAVDHHDHERIVTAVECQTRFEADVIATKLQSIGITAQAQHTDSPYARNAIGLAIDDYHHVLVFESDLARAQAIIAEDES
jgi:hypothetical protein